MNIKKTPTQEISYDLLNKELDRAYSSLNSHYNLLTQVVVIVTTLIGGLIAYAYSNITLSNPQFLNMLFFIAPLPILGLFGAAIVLLYQMGFFIYLIRDISDNIKSKFGAEFMLYYDVNSFASKTQSFLRGDSVFNFVRAGTLLIPTILFLGLVGTSFKTLYEFNHLMGIAFILIYGFGIAYLIIGLAGALINLPQQHKLYQAENYPDVNKAILELNKHAKISILRVFLPRPVDFLSKGFIVFLGIGIAVLENKIACFSSASIDCLPEFKQAIFSPPYPEKLYTLAIYIICWFIVQELFIQQAKYLWNDIRDQNSDRFIPANKLRPVTNSHIGILTYVELLLRWTLGFIFAYVLSSKLFWIVVLLSLLQGTYEFLGKPNSEKYPFIPLFVIAAGTSLRFLSGAYAVGWELSDHNLWIYSLIMFSLGITTSAIMWKVEAEYLLKQGKNLLRGQSKHFSQKGHVWLIASWLSCGVILSLLTSTIFLNKIIAIFVYFNNISLVWAFFINVVMGLVLFGISYFLVSPIFRLVTKIQDEIRKKMIGYLVVFIGLEAMIWLLINLWYSHLVVVIFGLLICMSFVQYWSIGYEEFSLMNLRKNSLILLKVLGVYIFVADSGIKISHVLWMIINLNSSSLEKHVSQIPKQQIPS